MKGQQTYDARTAMNSIRGAQNRAAGKSFEQIIQTACDYYRRYGIADIDKTPEPTRQLGAMGTGGRFMACYEKQAQPDFKGTLRGGRSVVFEAKFTSTDRMGQDVVLPQQAESLDRHLALGASCFVLCGFGARGYYRIPWNVWRGMKRAYGRKYITPADIEEYAVQYKGGMLQFLEEDAK